MFRRKGLFWYAHKKRLFDFSAPLSGHTFGYGNPYLNSKIKNALKKNSFIDFTASHSSAYVKSQLSKWCHHYPALNQYVFYLVSELDIINLFSDHQVITKYWELKTDLLLHSLTKEPKEKTSPRKVLITDSCLLYPDEDNTQNDAEDCSLYIHSIFPDILFPKNLSKNFNKDIQPFTHILVGGLHPFGLNGQKLLLVRDDQPTLSISTQPNHWHLEVYRNGIGYYFDVIERPGHRIRKTSMEKTLSSLNDLAKKNKIELRIENPHPLTAKLVLSNGKKSLTSLQEKKRSEMMFHKNRLFFQNLTVIAEECDNQIVFYLQLPVNFTPQHLDNKWKDFKNFFAWFGSIRFK